MNTLQKKNFLTTIIHPVLFSWRHDHHSVYGMIVERILKRRFIIKTDKRSEKNFLMIRKMPIRNFFVRFLYFLFTHTPQVVTVILSREPHTSIYHNKRKHKLSCKMPLQNINNQSQAITTSSPTRKSPMSLFSFSKKNSKVDLVAKEQSEIKKAILHKQFIISQSFLHCSKK